MDKQRVASELLKLARSLVKESRLNDLSDSDNEEYQKIRENFASRLRDMGFDDKENMAPRFSFALEDEDGPYTIDVNDISAPSHSVITNQSKFRLSLSVTDGKGRGGRVLDRQAYSATGFRGLSIIIKKALRLIDELISDQWNK